MSEKKKKHKSEKMSDEAIAEKKKKSDVADEAFRKKVSIIFGCILLVFTLAVIGVILFAWWDNKTSISDFEEAKISAQEAAKVTDSDKSVVDIKVTDKNYYDWIVELDSTYQAKKTDSNYKIYDGDTIEIEGKIVKKEFGDSKKITEYWVYRKYLDASGNEMQLSIEVKFDGEAPADETWVKAVGILGSSETYSLSCIHDATITVLDEPGEEYVK